MTTKRYILFFLSFLTIFHSIAQSTKADKEPQLGLALSGGGAKGLAHIGLLRLLDSLDIQPDYITGTSMGSIIGALYSIGYSGDELKSIAINTDWTGLLSNKLPFKDINIEEKDEYGRYLLEMPLSNGKLKLPKGFIRNNEFVE